MNSGAKRVLIFLAIFLVFLFALSLLDYEHIYLPIYNWFYGEHLVYKFKESENISERKEIVRTLAQLNQGAKLLSLLQSDEVENKAKVTIIGALGFLKYEKAVPYLIKLMETELHNDDSPILWAATDAASWFDDSRFITVLKKILASKNKVDYETHLHASESLLLLGDIEAGLGGLISWPMLGVLHGGKAPLRELTGKNYATQKEWQDWWNTEGKKEYSAKEGTQKALKIIRKMKELLEKERREYLNRE